MTVDDLTANRRIFLTSAVKAPSSRPRRTNSKSGLGTRAPSNGLAGQEPSRRPVGASTTLTLADKVPTWNDCPFRFL
jgi:hypothetical protein